MVRKILAITGTRADYGIMTPIYRKIHENNKLYLELVVTGMHLLPEFISGLKLIREHRYGKLHYFPTILEKEDTYYSITKTFAMTTQGLSAIIKSRKPKIILLQGDRGEMLAGAIASAYANVPIVHMSGGDFSGSIDDSLRNSISKLAHIHLTTCKKSSQRLLKMGEESNRIYEVGEPIIELINETEFIPSKNISNKYQLDLTKPIILAIQHPVSTESENGNWQIRQTLQALEELQCQTIFIYPNRDVGGIRMTETLESYRKKSFIKIFANIKTREYLSLMKIASMIVGNSSSGIIEAPSFKLPAINIGSRQHHRLKSTNVIDVDYDKNLIKKAILYALNNTEFKSKLKKCKNPYGTGKTSSKTVNILLHLHLKSSLLTKWIKTDENFVENYA